MKFAKIFMVGADDQVLVVRSNTDEGTPAIVLSTIINDEQVSFAAVFDPRDGETADEARARRDLRFDAFSRDDAFEFYDGAKLQMTPAAGGVN